MYILPQILNISSENSLITQMKEKIGINVNVESHKYVKVKKS